MINIDRYAKAIEVTDLILLPALIISSILNVLYLTDVVTENTMRIGITCVISILLVMNLINLIRTYKNKNITDKIKNEKKVDKIFSNLIVAFNIVWAVLFLICMLVK